MALTFAKEEETFEICETDMGLVDADKEVFYTLRRPSDKTKKDLRKSFTKTFRNVSTFDQEGYGDALLDYVLVGWKGILLNGDPAPCVLEWKQKLGVARSQAIAEIVGATMEDARGTSFRGAP
jgi:hypothetical protein